MSDAEKKTTTAPANENDEAPDPCPCDSPYCRQREERAAWEARQVAGKAAPKLAARDQAELHAVADGLLLHDEASVRRRKRLEDAGLIAFRGWELTPAGKDALNGQ